jgi:tRNA dimethylallyltransferase
MPLKKLIVIAGPTASGKTALAIELAKALNTVIISADARQFYRETTIGTAKASAAELAAVPHYFINNLSIHDTYDVGKYETEVLSKLDELFLIHDKVILCGGSGLFIKAITEGLDELPVADEAVRNNIAILYQANGLTWLQNEIKLKDPDYFAQADIQNPKRLIRALEVIEQTGKPFSSFHKKNPRQRNFESIKICLDIPRDELYMRINNRVLNMFENGLEQEAKTLYPFKHLNALQTVGYTEMFEYFDGKISMPRAIELIQQHTRNYAKRQLTWFRKDSAYIWCKPDIAEILKHC